MAKSKGKSNLDFVITKLKKSIGEIKVIEHIGGVSFGGIHEVNSEKSTVTIINELGLEKIKQAEKDNSSTEAIYSDSNCMDVIPLENIRSIK